MPRNPVDTRQSLYLAGLRRFASEGWHSARIRDIVADAGQGNDSAINYHFGSRRGLRCTLRVIAQVGPLTEVGRTITAGPVAGTALQDQIEILVSEAARRCGPDMARHRVRQLVVAVTSELAVRAESGPGTFPSHEEYVADLVDWMAGGLSRPRVAPTAP